MNLYPLIASILTGGFVSLLIAIITLPAQRRKLLAEAGDTAAHAERAKALIYTELAESTVELVEPMRQRIRELQEELKQARDEVKSLRIELVAAHQEADRYMLRIRELEKQTLT